MIIGMQMFAAGVWRNLIVIDIKEQRPIEKGKWKTFELSYVGNLRETVLVGGGKLSPSPGDPGEPRKPRGAE